MITRQAWSWACRRCPHRWRSPIWTPCPKCRAIFVWCLSGQWFNPGCPPWSDHRTPDDVIRIMQALPLSTTSEVQEVTI